MTAHIPMASLTLDFKVSANLAEKLHRGYAMRLAVKRGTMPLMVSITHSPHRWRFVMETYSSSPNMRPVAVGGLVGHIFPPADGRFVGGCTGSVRPESADRRYVGGCVGHVAGLGRRRFVGGCAGYSEPGAYLALSDSPVYGRADREALAGSSDAGLEAA
jgi:hypothetical protein